jgi:hypothetical protein
MTKRGYSVVQISVGRPTRARLDALDLARRQADHLGPYGFRAKNGETNIRYMRDGFLRLIFPSRGLAKAYIDRVTRLGEPRIRMRLMRNPGRYPLR